MDFTWRAVPFDDLRRFAAARRMIALDGRGSGGKTSLSGRLAAAIPGTAMVHTDDIAWSYSVLDWTDALVEGVLRPVRASRAVSYRPPGWVKHGREGAVTVPADCPLLIVEGVGSGRRSIAAEYDAVIWVETPAGLAAERNRVRLDAGETNESDYAAWMAEENPFVDEQRTWERADLVVAGWPIAPYDPDNEILTDRPIPA